MQWESLLQRIVPPVLCSQAMELLLVKNDLTRVRLSFPAGFPETLGWISEFFARLVFIQARIWQPANRVLAGE